MIPTLDAIERGIDGDSYRFALTGQTWALLREHYTDILPRICVRGAVFARMTSDQKQQLVVELMQLGYYVGVYLIFSVDYDKSIILLSFIYAGSPV